VAIEPNQRQQSDSFYAPSWSASGGAQARSDRHNHDFQSGHTSLKNKFPNFNKHVKAKNWSEAAKESKRGDIGEARNKYVKELFEKAAKSKEETKAP
jgi:hypothetical protein